MYSQQQLTPDQTPTPGARLEDAEDTSTTQRPYVWLANDDSVAAVSKNWDGLREHAAGALQRAQHQSA